MDNHKIEQIRKIAELSKEALNHSLNSFDVNNTKIGYYLSITAFSLPLFLNLLNEKETSFPVCIFIFLILGLLIILVGFLFFLIALRTKKVGNGVSYEKYDSLINENEEKILLFEIAANRDSIKTNKPLLEKQESFIKNGLILTFIGIVLFTLVFLINKL